MQQIIPHHKCTGCAACYTVCNHKAITMQFDEEGFEFPMINQSLCVDCGLCASVCPVLHYDFQKRKDYSRIQKAYAVRNRNYNQRLISSSGGVFPVLAEEIIKMGGIVYGTAFDEQFNAIHLAIETNDDIVKLQGSKYLQCKADDSTFRKIRKELNSGRVVLYSGMACQVEGLKAYLNKDYDNLFTIDLICMGIPSSRVWQIYLQTFFRGEIIKHVNFKEKSVGWNSFCFYVETNKRTFKERGMHNLYLQSMFRSWNMRVSCFQCPFKKAERLSDFTLADCWGVSRSVPEIDDNKGLSSVIVHSEKGLELWNAISCKIDQMETEISEIAKGNSNLVSNKQPAGNRDYFYQLLSKNPQKAFKELCSDKPSSFYQRIKAKIRRHFRWL